MTSFTHENAPELHAAALGNLGRRYTVEEYLVAYETAASAAKVLASLDPVAVRGVVRLTGCSEAEARAVLAARGSRDRLMAEELERAERSGAAVDEDGLVRVVAAKRLVADRGEALTSETLLVALEDVDAMFEAA
jgi:hypothetical protein